MASMRRQWLLVRTACVRVHVTRLVVPIFLQLVVLLAGAGAQTGKSAPRALVADAVSSVPDPHGVVARSATDALASALNRQGVYSVIAASALERAARARRLEPPYEPSELRALAGELKADFVLTSDVQRITRRTKDGRVWIEVGLIVHVREAETWELANGAAELVAVHDAAEADHSSSLPYMEAAVAAAERCAARIAGYRPIVGTVLNSSGSDILVINRGAEHGVRPRMEFRVFRRGQPVGRVRVFKVMGGYTQVKRMEGAGGIGPEDRAVAVFPEPRLK